MVHDTERHTDHANGRPAVGRRRRGRTIWGALCVVGIGVLGACSSGDGGDASFSDVDVDDGDVAAAQSEVAALLRDEGLTTLASALDVVGVDQLIDAPEFTLLAPSDDAFQSMDPDEMGDLLADPANLLDVLRNHVIDEQLLSDDIAPLDSLRSVAGNDLAVSESDGVLTIGGATVLSIDLSAGNGTIHVVDRVLVP